MTDATTLATRPHIEGVDCTEASYRGKLTDAEYWPYVLQGIRPGEEPDYDGPDLDDDALITNQNAPCPECGEHGACAYDAEGRAMTHVTTRGDNDD